MLAFDQATHRYTFAGRPVPHVTGIIAGAQRFAGVPERVLEAARQRGQAIHRAIELHLSDNLDEQTLAPDTAACLDQFRKAYALNAFTPALQEWKGYSARYGYAGTVDFFGRLATTKPGRYAVVDWKRTASVSPAVGLQLAAYEQIISEAFPAAAGKIDRFALHLGPHGFKLIPFTNPGDWPVFGSALTLWRFCDVHKLID